MQSRSVDESLRRVRPSTNQRRRPNIWKHYCCGGVPADKTSQSHTSWVLDKPGVAARIFAKAIGDANVNVDMIVQNISHGRGNVNRHFLFTVGYLDLLKAQGDRRVTHEIGFWRCHRDGCHRQVISGRVESKSHTGAQ